AETVKREWPDRGPHEGVSEAEHHDKGDGQPSAGHQCGQRKHQTQRCANGEGDTLREIFRNKNDTEQITDRQGDEAVDAEFPGGIQIESLILAVQSDGVNGDYLYTHVYENAQYAEHKVRDLKR